MKMDLGKVTLDGQPLRVLAEGAEGDFIFAEYGGNQTQPEGYVVFRTDPVTLLYRGPDLSPAYDEYMKLLAQEAPVEDSHPNLYPHPLPPAEGKASNHTLVKRLGEHIPDFYEMTGCPRDGCGRYGSIYVIVQHVNDDHGWTREAIADWLETLDLDLTVHQDPVRADPPLATGGVVQAKSLHVSQVLADWTAGSSLPTEVFPPIEWEPKAPDLTALKEAAAQLNEAWGPVAVAAQKMKAELGDVLIDLSKSPAYQAVHEMIEALQHPTKEQS